VATHPLPHLQRPITRLLLRVVIGVSSPLVEVEDPDRLREMPDPALFLLNHNNSIESVLAPATIMWHRQGRPVHFMVDWMYLRAPILGWILRQIEPIPVYTKPARWRLGEGYRLSMRRRSPVDDAVHRLTTGNSVGVFPEGTRNRNPSQLLPGRPGVAHVILRSDAPVVPIGLEYRAAQTRGKVPAIGRVRIRPGLPIDLEELRTAARDATGGAGDTARFLELRRQVTGIVMSALAPLCSKHAQPVGGFP
jgi:1-acyl-sn-glycerol-3-phosphate acyltransferase